MRYTRPAVVDHLADAYRHKGRSRYADRVIAARHLDAFPAECAEALARVRIEIEAGLVVKEAYRDLINEADGGIENDAD